MAHPGARRGRTPWAGKTTVRAVSQRASVPTRNGSHPPRTRMTRAAWMVTA